MQFLKGLISVVLKWVFYFMQVLYIGAYTVLCIALPNVNQNVNLQAKYISHSDLWTLPSHPIQNTVKYKHYMRCSFLAGKDFQVEGCYLATLISGKGCRFDTHFGNKNFAEISLNHVLLSCYYSWGGWEE